MKKQEKFMTRPIKLKVHTVNLQAISSYPVRFSADTLFFSLVFFCLLSSCYFWFSFFEIKYIYSDTHFIMRVGEQ